MLWLQITYLGWGKALGNEEDTGAGGNTEEGSGTSPSRSQLNNDEREGIRNAN